MQDSSVIQAVLDGKPKAGWYIFPFQSRLCLLKITVKLLLVLIFGGLGLALLGMMIFNYQSQWLSVYWAFVVIVLVFGLIAFFELRNMIYLLKCFVASDNCLVITPSDIHLRLAGKTMMYQRVDLVGLTLHTSGDLFFGNSGISYADKSSAKRYMLLKGRNFGALEEIFRVLTNH